MEEELDSREGFPGQLSPEELMDLLLYSVPEDICLFCGAHELGPSCGITCHSKHDPDCVAAV
jgi:hypothetical protein